MQKMSREENVVLIKSRAKFCVSYATFSLRDSFFVFAQLLMCMTFSRIILLYDLFLPEILKTKGTAAWGMHDKFQTNVEVGVNSCQDTKKFLNYLYN